MSVDLEDLSSGDFDRLLREQQKEVGRLRSALKAAERKLNWLREGRDLYLGPEPEPDNLALVSREEHPQNGRPPSSLTEAIVYVLHGKDEMPTIDIVGDLLKRGWITEDDRHTASSMLSNMTNRGQLERVGRGVYRLPFPDAGRDEP
jgi:hypothetical protein